MAEHERKFLIKQDDQISPTPHLIELYPSVDDLIEDVINNGVRIRQGYLPIETGISLAKGLNMRPDFNIAEARLRDKDGVYIFTIKGDGDQTRGELEREIRSDVFDSYWPATEGKRVEKIRLKKPYGNLQIEIDVYTDGRELVVAEVEAEPEILQDLLPLGIDVTSDKKYKNKNLAR